MKMKSFSRFGNFCKELKGFIKQEKWILSALIAMCGIGVLIVLFVRILPSQNNDIYAFDEYAKQIVVNEYPTLRP